MPAAKKAAEPSREEASFPDDCLFRALRMLTGTGSAAELGLSNPVKGDTLRERAVATYGRRERALAERVRLVHTSVLFAAIGVEASANLYIASLLPNLAEHLDNASTIDKLVLAPVLATGAPCFSLSLEPLGGVVRLFKLRNRVVHPKVGRRGVVGAGAVDYTPRAAADALISAAGVVKRLAQDADVFEGVPSAALILEAKAALREASSDWTDSLPTPPDSLAEALLDRSRGYGTEVKKPRVRIKRAPRGAPRDGQG